MLKREIRTLHAILFILSLSLISGFLLLSAIEKATAEMNDPHVIVRIQKKYNKPVPLVYVERPKPAPVSMERVKRQGCVADGLLTEYSPEHNDFIKLINRSECYYFHRAIETWLKPPDFNIIHYNMSLVKKTPAVYGMFIAEALKTNADYYNEMTHEKFDFKAMCREGSENAWGEHSCKPNFASKEYQRYIKYITQKAIDYGIQSFTFGQIYMQEGGEKNYAPEIVKEIRRYAQEKKVDIIIGAQTGDIDDEDYLALFDYVEGGVGINSEGELEDGPCLSSRSSCWALLWHEKYAAKAKNILLHLDWSGIRSDDLDIFARMSKSKRAETLKDLYAFFAEKEMGFLMPFFGVLDKTNGGCYGPKKRYYSPDKKYSCDDESIINDILKRTDL